MKLVLRLKKFSFCTLKFSILSYLHKVFLLQKQMKIKLTSGFNALIDSLSACLTCSILCPNIEPETSITKVSIFGGFGRNGAEKKCAKKLFKNKMLNVTLIKDTY